MKPNQTPNPNPNPNSHQNPKVLENFSYSVLIPKIHVSNRILKSVDEDLSKNPGSRHTTELYKFIDLSEDNV